MKNDKIYFENLDSIRFIAASMVLLDHTLIESYKFLHIENTVWEKLLNIISNGGNGVSIFFVLSGFLITYLLISEYELKGKIEIKNFYIRRILRIWPLYFAVIAFSFLVYPILKTTLGINNPLGSNILYHLSFLSNFDVIIVKSHFSGTDALSQNITWSVSVEEQFYLFWPLIFTFLPKRFWLGVIASTIIFSLGFRISHNGDALLLYYHSFSVLLDLGIGGLLAYLVKSCASIRAFFENCSTKMHMLFFLFSFSLLYWGLPLFLHFGLENALTRIYVSFSFGLIICAQAITKSNSFLNLKHFKLGSNLGKYTYGIYLIHPILIIFMDVFTRLIHLQKDNFYKSFGIGVAVFILTLVVSKLSYTYFESRFLKLKDKFTVIKTHE